MTAAENLGTYSAILDNVELVRLHEFSLILNSTHNIDQILKESAKAIQEILDGDGCHISLAQGLRDDLRLTTAIHEGSKPFPLGVDETKGITGITFATGQVIVVKDTERDPRVTKLMVQSIGHRSLVSAPIVVKGKVIGVAVVYSSKPNNYTERDGEFLLMLGNHLGLAVENARLLHELKKAASIDPLTGAFNRGYFHDELTHLLKGQGDELISLIMIDINDLKIINDTYGHTAGDCILQEVTRILKQNVRSKDIVSRYGGDEFAIILPSTDKDEALGVAKRIEQAMNEQCCSQDGKRLELKVSWGTFTTRCKEVKSINQLIDAADVKLYNMKRQSKKCN